MLLCIALLGGWLWGQNDTLAPITSSQVIQAGPMLGYAEMKEVCIWIQTKLPSELAIRYWPEGKKEALETQNHVRTQDSSYNIAKMVVSHLEPDTRYEYEVWVNGQNVSFPYPLSFQTTQFFQWRSEPKDFSFVLGSCLYENDPPNDRPGTPYGGDLKILEKMADAKADFMLWLGDNWYYREPEFYSHAQMLYRCNRVRSLPEMQRFLASCNHYAVWDDHDYGPNNSNRSYANKEFALELFKAFWANPHYGTKPTPGVFFSFSWNDVDFFMCDDRFYRAPNETLDPDKDYLGPDQLQWLEDSLATSNATFKIIVGGGQNINFYDPSEGYHHYGGEQKRLLNFIELQGIEGILFLSGDRHFTELIKLDRPGAYPLYEFTNSPISSGTYSNMTDERLNPLRVEGTLVNTVRNFGTISVSGPRKERQMTLRTFDAEGKLLWEKVLTRKQLSNPKRR
ncbi:MAG: alkaline phosphatase D family protein [Acidobacteria bacterium]|nr:alkaline phosphatase D family protein [Acidobacteriota bacterium]